MSVQLTNLPDEILLIIFKKLDNTSLFYSLFGINKSFDKLLSDSIFTQTLSLIERYSVDHVYSLSERIIDQFCWSILPKIAHKIQWLDLEISSMERILLSGNYVNLCGLRICDIKKTDILHYFSKQTSLTEIFQKQITSLVIQTKNSESFPVVQDSKIFASIMNMFSNLKFLNYDPFDSPHQWISFEYIHQPISSSTLLELHVNVRYFNDCLRLLDGRFSQLAVFNVKIDTSFGPNLQGFDNKLLNLKKFSLLFYFKISYYDEEILPLLYRMSNLEELYLYFDCSRKQSFIDGNHFQDKIFSHLSYLKKFQFNICSFVDHYDRLNLLSNEYIRNTFRQFPNERIMSCIDYFPEKDNGQCHVYSYPYSLKTYEHITNNFPGGSFENVRKVCLFDEQPFEHEFFVQIQKSFPLLKILMITNSKSQRNNDKNRDLSLIHYEHLDQIFLIRVHDDYVAQFLLDTRTILPIGLKLYVNYESLRRVTNDFQRIETKTNCSNINCIYINDQHEFSIEIRHYF